MSGQKGFWHGFTVSAGDRAKNQAKATKRWRENNKERYLASCKAYTKKWAEENRERRRETQRAYYRRHREKETARKLEYQKKNREKTNEAARRYRARQKEIQQLPRCMSCESVLKESSYYCNWCVQTYNLTHETTRK